MKTILMAAVALTAVTATPALAATNTASYKVTGTVGAACGAITGATLDFGSLVDTDGTIKAGSVTPASQTAYCTGGNSTATVSKVDLNAKTVTTAPTGFVNTVAFTPSVTVGGTSVAADGTAHAVGAFSGNLVVGASISASASRPVADDYEGSITVTLTPAA